VIVLNPLEVVPAGGAPVAVPLPLVAAVTRPGLQIQSARFDLEQPEKAWTQVAVIMFQRHIIYIASLDRLARLATDLLPKSGSGIDRAELLKPLIKALAEANIDLTTATREAELKAVLVDRLGR
jgi:hypothetical protein